MIPRYWKSSTNFNLSLLYVKFTSSIFLEKNTTLVLAVLTFSFQVSPDNDVVDGVIFPYFL
jgi:hypothetical protein